MTGVLFLTESFHPVLGGGEGHIRQLSGRLAAAGLRASVLTRRIDATWPVSETLDGVRVLRVGPAGGGRRGKYAMVGPALAALRRERHAFDVLVVRGTRVLGLPGLAAGRVLGKAVVLQPELNGEMSGEVYTWGTPLDVPAVRRVVAVGTAARNLLLRDADAFVAMSRAIAAECLAAGAAPERVVRLPHGVDTTRFSPASPDERQALRARQGLPESAVVVTYTGRLLRGKGLETLIEAAACGLSAIGARTGGIVDVIEDGASGLLVPPGDAAALASAMRTLFADPRRRAQMGRRAREIARERFDLEDSVCRYAALFRELRG